MLRCYSHIFATLCCTLTVVFNGRMLVKATTGDSGDDVPDGGSAVMPEASLLTSTFASRVIGYTTDSYITSPLQRPGGSDSDSDGSSPLGKGDSSVKKAAGASDSVDSEKLKRKPLDRDEFNKLLLEILKKPDPLYGTEYNREWGRSCLTVDGDIPKTEDLLHFDVFDPFLPTGIEFEDLRSLFLYNVQEGYHLYKLRLGDMVVTLRPDLDQVSVHLFEDYWGLLIVRVLFAVEGILQRHEYTENSRGSRTFHKTMGPSLHYPPPKVNTTNLSDWLEEKYRDLSKRRPPMIEEVIKIPK